MDRVDYNTLISGPTTEDILNFAVQQLAPNRFNILADFISALFGAYVNNWIMVVWFLTSIPVNIGYLTYYYIDPTADMPPFIQFWKVWFWGLQVTHTICQTLWHQLWIWYGQANVSSLITTLPQNSKYKYNGILKQKREIFIIQK